MRRVMELAEVNDVYASSFEDIYKAWRFGNRLTGHDHLHDELVVKVTAHGLISWQCGVAIVVRKLLDLFQRGR